MNNKKLAARAMASIDLTDSEYAGKGVMSFLALDRQMRPESVPGDFRLERHENLRETLFHRAICWVLDVFSALRR